MKKILFVGLFALAVVNVRAMEGDKKEDCPVTAAKHTLMSFLADHVCSKKVALGVLAVTGLEEGLHHFLGMERKKASTVAAGTVALVFLGTKNFSCVCPNAPQEDKSGTELKVLTDLSSKPASRAATPTPVVVEVVAE